jgi:DNA-binding response OmpR family regulator
MATESYDLVLMEVSLPDGSGLDLCKRIRDWGNGVPILFLSALTDEAIVVKAIKIGADDYLRKPFDVEELKFRINKYIHKTDVPSLIIQFGNLVVDPKKRIASILGQILTLGRKELDILTLLAKKSGDIVTRKNIVESLYENADLYHRTVDSHISHLRRKIREVAGVSLKITSVYGLGYRLEWKGH